jgi:hypothetical protein
MVKTPGLLRLVEEQTKKSRRLSRLTERRRHKCQPGGWHWVNFENLLDMGYGAAADSGMANQLEDTRSNPE